jgi:hypothetical protein
MVALRQIAYDNILFRVSSGEMSLEDANFPTDGHRSEFLRKAEPYFLEKNDMNNYNKAKSMRKSTC